jgi:hypothetical protein
MSNPVQEAVVEDRAPPAVVLRPHLGDGSFGEYDRAVRNVIHDLNISVEDLEFAVRDADPSSLSVILDCVAKAVESGNTTEAKTKREMIKLKIKGSLSKHFKDKDKDQSEKKPSAHSNLITLLKAPQPAAACIAEITLPQDVIQKLEKRHLEKVKLEMTDQLNDRKETRVIDGKLESVKLGKAITSWPDWINALMSWALTVCAFAKVPTTIALCYVQIWLSMAKNDSSFGELKQLEQSYRYGLEQSVSLLQADKGLSYEAALERCMSSLVDITPGETVFNNTT